MATSGILNSDEFRSFRILWSDHEIKVLHWFLLLLNFDSFLRDLGRFNQIIVTIKQNEDVPVTQVYELTLKINLIEWHLKNYITSKWFYIIKYPRSVF